MCNLVHARKIRACLVATSLLAIASAQAEPSMDQSSSPSQPTQSTQYRQLTPHPMTTERVHPHTHTRGGDTPGNPPPRNDDKSTQPVSYGSGVTPKIPAVRTEDLPSHRGDAVDCKVVKAKIRHLEARLAQINRVRSALSGVQGVDYGPNSSGTATSFSAGGSPDDALSKLDQETGDIQDLMAKYGKDLQGC
jgi:hypothetical protein